MCNKALFVLVLISLGLGGYATWKVTFPNSEEMAQLTIRGMKDLQAKSAAKEREKQAAAIKERAKELHADKTSPQGGNPDGDLTVTYFFDYRCGYCRKVDPTLDALIEADPNLKIVYKQHPMFQDAMLASAALAAHKQGKYLEMHRALMAHKGEFSKDVVMKIVKEAGLNEEQFNKDIVSEEVRNTLQEHHQLGKELGVQATPMFIVGGSTTLPGAVDLDEFQSVIQKAREEAAGGTSQEDAQSSSED